MRPKQPSATPHKGASRRVCLCEVRRRDKEAKRTPRWAFPVSMTGLLHQPELLTMLRMNVTSGAFSLILLGECMRRDTENRIQINKHYIIIDASDIQTLMMDVNDVMATGQWAVCGGVSQSINGDGVACYLQALNRIKPAPSLSFKD